METKIVQPGAIEPASMMTMGTAPEGVQETDE